jgi:hypothetical protein
MLARPFGNVLHLGDLRAGVGGQRDESLVGDQGDRREARGGEKPGFLSVCGRIATVWSLVSSSVLPSGAAALRACAAIRPPAPGRFSTMTGWSSAVDRPSARMRADASSPRPGKADEDADGLLRRLGQRHRRGERRHPAHGHQGDAPEALQAAGRCGRRCAGCAVRWHVVLQGVADQA